MVASLTPDRLAELRRVAAETTPGTYEWRIIETALALLDRIEALERRNSEIAQLIIDAITWFYDEDTGSVTVTDDDPRGGLEQLRQALLLLDPAAAARFPQFWRW